jgi:hypothetical protein
MTFGQVFRLVADRDVRMRESFRAQLEQMGTTLHQSTTHHAPTNGNAEKANGLASGFLRTVVALHQRDWPQHLPAAQVALNNRVISSRRMSPHYAVFGYEFRGAVQDAMAPLHTTNTVSPTQHALSLQDTRMELFHNILQAQELLAQAQNARNDITTFKPGDWVRVMRHVIRDPEAKVQDSPKLAARFSGPFRVDAIVAPGAYRLVLPPSYRAHPVVSITHLQPFHGTVSEGPGTAHVDGLDDTDMYEVHAIEGHRTGKGNRRNKWQFLTSWTGYFYPRDRDWYPPSCFVTKDFINIIFQDYVIKNSLPPELLDHRRVGLLSGPAPARAAKTKPPTVDSSSQRVHHHSIQLITPPRSLQPELESSVHDRWFILRSWFSTASEYSVFGEIAHEHPHTST